MTTWIYQDQDGQHTISEEDILRDYYSWWKTQMEKVGKAHLINPQACIEDFVVVHWAYKQDEK